MLARRDQVTAGLVLRRPAHLCWHADRRQPAIHAGPGCRVLLLLPAILLVTPGRSGEPAALLHRCRHDDTLARWARVGGMDPPAARMR